MPWPALLSRHPGSPLLQTGAYLAATGWIGVDLFFVLSGFLIGSQLLRFFENGQHPAQLWRFFAHRALRILPAYYTLLLLIQFALPRNGLLREAVFFQHIPQHMHWHWLLLQDYTGAYIYPVLWSLGVEEKFYLMAPLLIAGLLLASRRAGRHRHTLILIALSVLLVIPAAARLITCLHNPSESVEMYRHFRFSMLHLRCDGLIAGLMVAFVLRYLRARLQWLNAPRLPGALMLLGLLVVWRTSLWLPGDMDPTFSVVALSVTGLLLAVGFGLMVLGGVLLPNPSAGWLGSRIFYGIATISYSLYLLHSMLVAPVSQAWFAFSYPLSWPVEAQLAAYLLLFCLAAGIIATGYYGLVEKPFLVLKKRIQ
ncbi:MAG: acyltransferase family protein [Candidatus Melainabacteria bacterium]